jgi:hypothetical protein
VRARVLLVVLALFTAVACGGSSDGDSGAAASPSPSVDTTAADTTAITTNWEAFFKGGGSVDQHILLLEDGDQFKTELTAQSKDPNNKSLAAKVTNVKIDGESAVVTYNLLGAGGTALLTAATGTAVKVDGEWKVAKKTYCQLISLQDPTGTHTGCTSG